ncbi:MAG TPA: asparagine synthase-related protein [Thermoleophilia bacterium]
MPDSRGIRQDGPGQAETLVFETDWLATRPFYYNVRTGRCSRRIDEVIDLTDLEFDPEGLNDYLDFGFSVFGHTPVRDVRMLRFSSRLYSGPAGLRVDELDDPAYAWLERSSGVDEVVELAEELVNEAAAEVPGEVVVPTSGGFDSRFIDVLLRDRSRVRAFTYGVSGDQARSAEAVKAAELCRRLGIRWELIPLGDFHRYLDEWDGLFGVSTHAHGMYHIEFYRQILSKVRRGSLLLTGASGEWFSGDDPEVRVVETLRGPEDLLEVFRYGRMCADSRQSWFRSERLGLQRLLAEQPRIRTEMLPRVFTVVRLRTTLLSYLQTVPESLGLVPRAPFLDIRLAMRMLTLPADLRRERRWERELFAAHDVDLEAASLSGDYRNQLNSTAMRRRPLRPLDAELLREIVRPEYVRWVNRNIGPLGLPHEAITRLAWQPGLRRAVKQLRRLGVTDRRAEAYGAYLTLRPLESLLRRRDAARGEGS